MTYKEKFLTIENDLEIQAFLAEYEIHRDYETLLTENKFDVKKWLETEIVDDVELFNKTMLLESFSAGLKVKADKIKSISDKIKKNPITRIKWFFYDLFKRGDKK